MELEVGMYVRTIKGKIWIITSQKAISGHRKDIIKASHNIIDLIEVGDYVNGRLVETIYDYDKKYLGYKIGSCYQQLGTFDIKSIVTKEMFSSVEYRMETN